MAKRKNRISRLTSAEADLAAAHRIPGTPQSLSPAYRLAFDDPDFLRSEALRPVRLQLELLKPELTLQERGVTSTVVLFGGARIPAPGEAPSAKTEIARENLAAASKYYEEARKFAQLATETSLQYGGREFVITTGGGPGIMEAGNKGAQEAGSWSIGLNIVLPHEQAPNAYVTPEFSFNFHYFAIRKMHFLMRAKAIAIFPGGYGTLDELFEVLTLIQTERMAKLPIVLFAPEFWSKIIDFEALRDAGTISPEDLDLFRFVETAEEAWAIIAEHHDLARQPPIDPSV
ncbi:MAG: LOG family protein [Pseudomonadota bacterium]